MSSIGNSAPTSDNGTATAGISALRTEPKNRKITTITMSTASTRVVCTSPIALRMYSVVSYAMRASRPSGSCGMISASQTRRTASMTSRAFASGATSIDMNVAFWPLKLTDVL